MTAAAGVGIGFAAAKKSVEEGCRAIVISDIHEGRLQASVDKLKEETGLQSVWGKVCNVVVEEEVRQLIALPRRSWAVLMS
jgi:3-oxoacyl-[acyl-carrier protein] reductase